MRFSSVFQLPVLRRSEAPQAQPARAAAEAAPAPGQDAAGELPDDLDQRVRLVGEWQIGEG